MTERTLREKISELIEEAIVNAEVDYPVDERAGPRIEWQHEQLMEDIGALLDAHTAAQPAPDAVAEARPELPDHLKWKGPGPAPQSWWVGNTKVYRSWEDYCDD